MKPPSRETNTSEVSRPPIPPAIGKLPPASIVAVCCARRVDVESPSDHVLVAGAYSCLRRPAYARRPAASPQDAARAAASGTIRNITSARSTVLEASPLGHGDRVGAGPQDSVRGDDLVPVRTPRTPQAHLLPSHSLRSIATAVTPRRTFATTRSPRPRLPHTLAGPARYAPPAWGRGDARSAPPRP